ncbi:MAG: hypothetical protein HYX74_02415 [Acidobacteria bacterium]|nr:hypothetical protein [Acidobacteriota bacterium]
MRMFSFRRDPARALLNRSLSQTGVARWRAGARRILTVAALLLYACASPVATKAIVSASPNPVPGGPGWATTTVMWDTGDNSWGQVYLFVEGQPEILFMEGSRGAKDAPWISEGPTYEFRLYAGKEHKKLLGTVKVRRGGT